MESWTEAMEARNGAGVESPTAGARKDRRPAALIPSWGFQSVPDPKPAAAPQRGEQAAAAAQRRASRPDLTLTPSHVQGPW